MKEQILSNEQTNKIVPTNIRNVSERCSHDESLPEFLAQIESTERRKTRLSKSKYVIKKICNESPEISFLYRRSIPSSSLEYGNDIRKKETTKRFSNQDKQLQRDDFNDIHNNVDDGRSSEDEETQHQMLTLDSVLGIPVIHLGEVDQLYIRKARQLSKKIENKKKLVPGVVTGSSRHNCPVEKPVIDLDIQVDYCTATHENGSQEKMPVDAFASIPVINLCVDDNNQPTVVNSEHPSEPYGSILWKISEVGNHEEIEKRSICSVRVKFDKLQDETLDEVINLADDLNTIEHPDQSTSDSVIKSLRIGSNR